MSRLIHQVPRVVIVDALVVALLFAAASWWGARHVTRFVESGRQPSYFQSYFEPAVMLACGRGFMVAAERPRIVDDFLQQRVDTVECGELPSELIPVEPGAVYQYAWFHLMTTVGFAWRVLGVSWSGLAPLFGVLFGAVIALAYGLFRIAVPPAVAVLPALALTASSLHLQNLPHLRDYAKAPFVLALILLLVWMVRRPMGTRALLGVSALYGTLLGVGYGFRTDLLANIPPFVVVVLLFLPGGVRANLRLKAAALALAAVTFAAASWPATSFVSERGGCQWHVVLLGLDDGFTHDLDVEPAFYGWASAYSDEYVHTAVNGHRYRMAGAGPAEYCSAEYDEVSAAYLRDIHTRFPADVLTRAFASVIRVLDLPFYWWYTNDDDSAATQRGSLGRLLLYIAGTARLAVLAAVVLIGAHSLRLGLFALSVVLYFGGYPSLQFSNRHYFHLEFIGWWAMAFLGWQTLRLALAAARRQIPAAPPDWWRLAGQAGRFAGVVAAIVLLPFPLVRAYQDRQVDRLVQSLLDAPRVEVKMTLADEDGMLRPEPGTLPWAVDDPTQTAYLDVHLDLSVCHEGVPLRLEYDPAAGIHDFSGPPRTPAPAAPAARVLLPVYRGFQGISLAGAPRECVVRVERLENLRGVPVLPVLTLPPDWSGQPFHQSFKFTRWLAVFRRFLPVSSPHPARHLPLRGPEAVADHVNEGGRRLKL